MCDDIVTIYNSRNLINEVTKQPEPVAPVIYNSRNLINEVTRSKIMTDFKSTTVEI